MLVHQLFEAQVRETPENMALTFEGKSLTYRKLNQRANQLAHHLRTLGVGPEVVVGICMERSLELVVAILGVLKAGGACLPLDPDYPKERLAFMLEDARVPILLTQQHLLAELFEDTKSRIEGSDLRSLIDPQISVVCLDSEWEVIARESHENPCSQVTSDNLSFVFYTSGSTGKPKAVMWSHGKSDKFQSWQRATYKLTEQDRHLLKSSIGFTLLSKEIFCPLLTGAQIIIVPPGLDRNTAYLVKLIAQHKITYITLVPSMLRMFLEEEGLEACTCLRHVSCGGEPLSSWLQERFFRRLDAELSVTYGATEAPTASLFKCKRKDPQRVVGMGRPLPGKEMHLLDDHLQPPPVGVRGEIYVGGRLARGYLNRADLTAEKFVPHPFGQKPGARLYRTGDLGRYLSDGSIEFIGRVDDQIKIRGYRIEPSEVEKVICEHPSVLEVVLVGREDESQSKRLVAYVVPSHPPPPSINDIRSLLKQKLPDYMIPSVFVFLDALPLSPNGKIDRKSLPVPGNARPEIGTPYLAPRTPLEKEIVEIWKEVLFLDSVGVHDNFLDLGGHSLSASQVISRIIKRFQLDLPVQSLFQLPTVAEMATLIAQSQAKRLSEEDLTRILDELESLSDEQAQEFVAQGGARDVRGKSN